MGEWVTDLTKRHNIGHYVIALLVVVFTVMVAQVLNQFLPHTSLLLLFMTSVVLVSAKTSLGPSLFSGILSFLSFNFFFTEPYYTLDVYHRSDLATLVLFLMVIVVTGRLAARMRITLSAYEKTLKKLDSLYLFSQQMSSSTDEAGVLELLKSAIETNTNQTAYVIVRDGSELVMKPAGHEKILEPSELTQAWHEARQMTLNNWMSLPVLIEKQPRALLVTRNFSDNETIETCQTLCRLAGIALQRIELVSDLQQSKVTFETEQLRSALLSSVSHDLRTPLASVIGSASSLVELGDKIDADQQRALLVNILNESERLDRHIQNLLDMTRFGQGKVKLKRDWVDIRDIISGALNRLSDVLNKVIVDVKVEIEDPIINVHGLLIEQALVNVIDNAIRFSPEQGHIFIRVAKQADQMVIEVADEGAGIADDDKERIFDMFYSLNQGDPHQRSGAGLGLAITLGMIGAHGGEVKALDDPLTHGALIRMSLPWIPHAQTLTS